MSLIAKEPIGEEKISKEDWFIDMICNLMIDILDVIDNRSLFKTLLKGNLLKPLMGTYHDKGILLQYEEMIKKDIITQFEIALGLVKQPDVLSKSEEDSDVILEKRNIYYLIKRIQKDFVKIEDIKSDGTFETLYEKNVKESTCENESHTTSEF